jgi:predicted dienelactone hydrolase
MLVSVAIAPAFADEQGVSVGFEKIAVPNGDEPDLVGGVWYPSSGVLQSQSVGPFQQLVVPSGPIAGRARPLIVLSHGGGGNYASHLDTALALARSGFIVASINHAGDTSDDQSKVLMLWRRPAQLSRLIDYMLSSWRGHDQIDVHRIGAYGFSNGGFTVLVEGGGVPDLLTIDSYCKINPSHDLCVALQAAGIKSVAHFAPPPGVWKSDPRIKAVAMAAPAFGFAFDRAGLVAVQVPVQLWRGAIDQHQPDPWFEEHIREGLTGPVDYRVVAKAGHYAFLPPCPPAMFAADREICTDAPGFDRAAFHSQLNAGLDLFFTQALH